MAKRSNDEWPVGKYHFLVKINGNEYSFQEASGLSIENSVIDYKVGSGNLNTMKLSGLPKYTNLVLKKGVFKNDDEIIKLFNMADNKYYFENKKINIVIELKNEKASIMQWNVKKAFPVKFVSTDFKSTENAIAVETVEFVYEELEIKKL